MLSLKPRPMARWLLVGLLSLCAAIVNAEGDVEGSHDHPLIKRFSGSTLVGYYHSDWTQTNFPLAAEMAKDNTVFAKAETVEGAVTRLVYLSPAGKTPLEVFRNYEQALQTAGLKTVFSCDGNCGALYFHWLFGPVRDAMKYTRQELHSKRDNGRWNMQDAIAGDEGRLLYGTLTQADRTLHVAVYSSIAAYAQTEAAATVIEIAEPKTMQTGQVTVDAAAMSQGLKADGKIALYGVYFDTGKAALKSESDPQLKEMARLLNSDASLEVFIVGHTDNEGSFDANAKLSLQRATAVRDALVNRYKIASKRITPYGVANVAPVASNATEDGRARNRRVELVVR